MSPPAPKPNPLRPRPVVLCILDGWGEREWAADNAIALARMPNWNRYLRDLPRARLDASALEVGLPEGQMGNSEVGHMNLGAGRVVMQELPRIDQAIKSGALAQNPRLGEFIAALKKSGGVCHLMGLLSPGGVHAHQDHMAALARIVAAAGVPVAVHAFLDGRDTPPRSALDYLASFETALRGIAGVRVATVAGRYYAMDRDTRWERVEKAFFALAEGKGAKAATPLSAVEAAYKRGESDEFVQPGVIENYRGMADGDGLLMANFRADRVREILAALADPAFSAFARPRLPAFAARAGMTAYSALLDPLYPALFVTDDLTRILGEVVADAGLRQLRIAETEKYAHVTFFLNGGREQEFPGEERILVPSPKVATYDLKPEMAADEVTDKLVQAIRSARFDLIVVNYANGDMVGHTGVLAAAIRAAETVDRCLGRLEGAVLDAGGALLITADHGNCEQMLDPETGQAHTAHTLNLVPAILVNGPPGSRLRDGRLSDVAPTILALLGLTQPEEMTGRSLLDRTAAKAAVGGRALLFCFLLAAASIVAASAGLAAETKDDPRRRLQLLEQEIARDRAQSEKLKQRAADLGAEVEKVRARAITAARSAQESERAVAQLQAEIAGLARAEARATQRLADRRAEASATVMALQRIALHPPEAVFARPGPPSEMVRGAILLRAAVPEVERRAALVRADLAQVRAAKADGARALGRQAAELAKLADERRALDEVLARRSALARETSADAKGVERRLAGLAAEARGLNELMDRLEAESARRSKAAVAPRTAARPSPSAPPLSPSTTPFARARGQLPMPAIGQVTLRYGQTTAAGLGHKGITLETQEQATVVAPFAGYVVFAEVFRGYGQLLILDHGDGYHTLLAGLDRIDGVPGLWVETGEPVGIMGVMSAGDRSRLRLYVEIRRGGQPFDPLPWLAAYNDKVSR